MVVAEDRDTVGHIVVDRFHGFLRRVDAAVRACIEIVVPAEVCAPRRVVKPVEVGHADPIFDEDVIVRPVEPDVRRLVIRVVKTRDRLVSVGKASDHVSEDDGHDR